jgi:lon-related putative ATP-dependent protease
MTNAKALDPQLLFHRCDPAQLGFETTSELEDLTEVIGQSRAMGAVQFGTGMRHEGYNLYVLGPAGMGKHTLVRQFLEGRAAAEREPADWCYINNFEQPHKPRALRLPAGRAAKLAQDMAQLVDELRNAIPAAFESDEYRNRAEEIQEKFNERQAAVFKKLGDEAEKQGIALLHTPGGFAFAPMHDGEVIGPDDYDKLPKAEQERVEKLVSGLEERLQKIIRQIPQWRKEKREKVKQLNREITMSAVGHLIAEIKDGYTDLPVVLEYLDDVQADVVEKADDFRKTEEQPAAVLGINIAERPDFHRYRVNVLVDQGESRAAPIVSDDNPTHSNLIGRVEHVAQLGALVTDFTLIKPGSLHRANGGYLLLDVRKVLVQPFAWEALKRALYSKEIRIESLGQMLSLVSTVSLEPEPIPLDVKVILFGERLFYYLLYEYDPEFSELFKVAADFEETMERSADNNLLYARLIGTLARKNGLQPLHRSAVARAIEHSARIVGDAEKLSTHLQSVADLVREADYWARDAGRAAVQAEDVQRAIDAQIHRADRLRSRIQEEILRGTVLIDTQGTMAGQVNGLAVIQLGDFAFAQPMRITATTRIGEGEFINVEREVELSGAIHSKGVLILSAFLAARYSRDRPLSLSASLAFEQSYGMVEGDSASLAELCALLSNLAGAPVKQSLAITGSVNQFGQAQAIGAVNDKIEGFFDICKARGLNGEQGVLIPASNVKHLMLRQDVVDAAAAGQFHIYPVENIDQAIELLTGVPAGMPDDKGELPENSINFQVAARLFELSVIRQSFAGAGKTEKAKKKS